jgi:uncharacterized protein
MATPNRLAEETSPYLLQHAHNPVEWFPWGQEALARAKREDKPILLSIGYAACHWCHVMERESFEDDAIAARMNEHFVCIKVDREERPDLDTIYMQATVAMGGSGGWPMTVFLTPDDRAPFFAGTYFPPVAKHGRPGFGTLLERIAELWHNERQTLVAQAQDLVEELSARAKPALPASVGQRAIEAAVDQLRQAFDATHGGFGSAPKFPPSAALELLLRHHRLSGDEDSLAMVRKTLDAMAAGGIYDHLAGGFARYSTDERWLVPHFEKMLYDNASLVPVYAQAFQLTGEVRDAEVVRETLDYVLREMTGEDGAFYSATDADSEGVEGKYFVWTPAEVTAILAPEQAEAFCAFYDVTPQGNWEGHSVLHTERRPAEVAAELALDEATLIALLGEAKRKMLAARQDRVPPQLDDKVLTAWNALMIRAFAEGGRALDEARYRDAAEKAADFIWDRMRRPDGGLFRTTRAGRTHLDAYLEDYAYLCDALVDTYEATGAIRHLRRARSFAERMLNDFLDEGVPGFFDTAQDHEALVVRTRDGQDGAMPSANAVAARALLRLSWHLGRDDWKVLAIDAVRAHGQLIERAPRAFCTSLCVADMVLEGPTEIVAVGEGRQGLLAAAGQRYLPNRIVVWAGSDTLAPSELVAGKTPIDGRAAIYVCRDFACQQPSTTPEEVLAQLHAQAEVASGGRASQLGARLAGCATEIGTSRYLRRVDLPASAFVPFGSTGLMVARVGFGGYRVDDVQPGFAQALRDALTGGCNLIDTSTNYTDGGSERLVGATLARLVKAGSVGRDEIVVVSKIGYVQGQNLDVARRRERTGQAFADMVKVSDDCWHCIEPEWLADQLERSLERLGLETLDLCLLHNPEYFLSHAAESGEVTDAIRDAFYERVERAFAWFETQVAAGRIGAYGVSSNSVAGTEADATDLARLFAAAKAAGGEGHHFRALQLPMNLVEREPLDAGVLELAQKHSIGVLVNRPLNAITAQTMTRLATPPSVPTSGGSFVSRLDEMADLEARFGRELRPLLATAGDGLFELAAPLRAVDGRITDLSQWERLARGEVIPLVSRTMQQVERGLPGAARATWAAWRTAYIRATEDALGALREQAAARHADACRAIETAIDEALPSARRSESLARRALWTLVETPGVAVVLLGMRRPKYVRDALATLRFEALPRWREVYDNLREQP